MKDQSQLHFVVVKLLNTVCFTRIKEQIGEKCAFFLQNKISPFVNNIFVSTLVILFMKKKVEPNLA